MNVRYQIVYDGNGSESFFLDYQLNIAEAYRLGYLLIEKEGTTYHIGVSKIKKILETVL